MSPALFLCQRCKEPLKLLQQQGGPLEVQHHANTPTEIPVSAESQVRTSGRPHSDGGRVSQGSALCTFTLLTSGGPDSEGGTTSQGNACCTFTLLGESASMRTMNTIQNTVLETFEILSDQKVVDHPLCVDCTDHLLMQLDDQLALLASDNQKYKSFQDRELLVSEEEREALHAELCAELSSLEQEEARLTQELEDLDGHHARVAAELRAAQAESKELYKQHEQHRVEYSVFKMEQLELMDQLSSVENQLTYALSQQYRLRQTNIFNATFTISDEGPLGVINNFRLGCLPGVRVGWTEISSAWGQTVLLLFSLSKIAGLQFQRYQLVPFGDHSYLKSLTGDGVLPLFSDGSHSVFLNNKFDCGMKAFLDCLQQFVEEIERDERCPCLPYRIHVKEGLMEDVWDSGECCSIRTHLNTEEEWSRALKFMLSDLKLILAWASLRFSRVQRP
ncbi:beclin-2 [Mus musculus]|uniref:Beclin-2 n=1 Tax=Mus musculus TaxID=10090 RepID=BECN2_MOUSE|nr:beclin-2 [Mus musculus]P0DM65.2 RecName: Full=Beclin-2 [Mus musculus]AGS82805.1 beclin 2 [Mus musculus]|eukprot:NP_001277621.1 beclin-2 [Mus musculus]